MGTKQFKAESKRLLEMMINSIYTHKEIFLRELISNASDAIDKLYFKSLTDTSIGLKRDDFAINIEADKENRTLTISDNGIGMTKDDLENNLGTIAKSGSLSFKKDNELGEDVDIIGQFGVGFYSAFMVAKEVTVVSKAYGEEKAHIWKSSGVSGYTIDECDTDVEAGTTITLKIKDNTDDENYDEFLEQYRIQALVKKYSDYIRFPIKMDMEKTEYPEKKEGDEKEPEPITVKETVTLNSMVPIWKKNKSELKEEDYNSFYTDKFMDYEAPLTHIHSKNEGIATYDALLFVPSKAPFDYYSKNYKKGLQLYSSGVMIMDCCEDLLPHYFMKKLLSFAMLFAFALCINAQQRKTWDFTKGISDATLENLVADPNWSVENNGDGTFKQAVDQAKMSGELMANNVIIEELRGIKFGTGGLSKNKNYIIGSNKFRMSRKNESLILRVAPGQTITMKARSANGDAPNRGFKGDANMEYVSGPENGICLGWNLEAEGRDERGDYTLVWKVKDEIEGLEGDSLDVAITASPEGGLDISLIQIDEGDNPQTDKKQVAYLYDSSYPGYEFGENDPNYDVLVNMLSLELEAADIVAIDVAGNPADVTVDSLQYYNAVVVSSAINSTNPYINTIKSAIAYVPMLNLSPDLYEAWGYGAARETNTNILTVGDKASKADMFTDADGNSFVADGKLAIFESAAIRGYEAAAGTYFANDSVWAKADGVNAIHVHNANRNAYMLLPYTFPYGDLAENFPQLMSNAVLTVAGTKTEVTKSGKPSMVQDFSNFSTTVTLRCSTKGARIYYTLDGSEPTLNSTEFTEPFVVDVKDVVVKAISMADGYSVSDVMEAKVEIHELAKAPSFSCNEMDGATEVTLIPANEGEVIYYNITGSSEIERSEIYSEPIVLTRHQTITAFTAAYSDYLASEPVSKDIVVKNEKVRIDIVSHMDANKADWAPAGANPTYYNGKNGHAYYSDNVIEQTTDPETGDDIFVCEPANVVVWVNPNKGWEVRTEAQAVFWQNNGCTHNVGDGSGYNPETALDDDVNATSSCLSFGSSSTTNSFGTKNPSYTGSIQSTEAFQGPFDVVANIANTAKNGGNIAAYVYVTTDTLGGNWTELGELKTSTTGRLWKNTVLGYEGTDKVFVKVCASNSVGVFDIFIKNEGELSKEYIANVTGIEIVNSNAAAAGNVVRTMIYSINGTQLDKVAKGINIVKEVYANGVVKTKKIIVK